MGQGNVIPFKKIEIESKRINPLYGKCLLVPRNLLPYVGHTGAIVWADLRRMIVKRDDSLFDYMAINGWIWIRLPLKWWAGSMGISIGNLRKCLSELEALEFIQSRQELKSFDKTKWYALNFDRG